MAIEETQKEDARYASTLCRRPYLISLLGFARRYFTLSSLGQLSYAFEPGKPSRDSIFLSDAAVSTYPGRKDIHIDSANVTFHLKCLSSEDFGKWMMAFRRFIATDERKSCMGLSTPRMSHISRSSAVVNEMGLVSFIQPSPQDNLLIGIRRLPNWRKRWFHGKMGIQCLQRPTRIKRQRKTNIRERRSS